MKRRLLLFAALAIFVLSLAACGGEDTQLITTEEAQNIALSHAGVKLRQVTRINTEYEIDDGVKQYEVEFMADSRECKYTIDAQSGAILDQEIKNPQNVTGSNSGSEQITTIPAENRISVEEAENVALNHANLSRDQVTFDRTEYDVDDGVPEYEIEFHHDGWEYSYDIHAETGKVLSSEKDLID